MLETSGQGMSETQRSRLNSEGILSSLCSFPVPNYLEGCCPVALDRVIVSLGASLAMDTVQPLTLAVLDSLREPAILLGCDHRIYAANRRYREKFAAGGDVVGRHCYEVSHGYSVPCHQAGERCPMLCALETGEECRAVHLHRTPEGARHEDVVLQPLCSVGSVCQLFLERLRPIDDADAEPCAVGLVGRSSAFRHMLELVARVAKRDTAVLLHGESGTGKELVATALHRQSRRADRPFVPVDCSGLAESLFESELFGHERGAFTGAAARKKGLVEAAEGGTLFLDEIGDVPLTLQVKLLRLLETKSFRRVGSTQQKRAEFRLVSATHHDLRTMVAEGRFREDLFYRLSAFPIRLPPLRERVEDLPVLVQALLERLGCGPRCRMSSGALDSLRGYDFPGNVRELLNILERACLLADDGEITADHLPERCRARPIPARQRRQIVPLVEAEENYLRWAVASFHGDNRALADTLGISERTLYRRLERIRAEDALAATGGSRPEPTSSTSEPASDSKVSPWGCL